MDKRWIILGAFAFAWISRAAVAASVIVSSATIGDNISGPVCSSPLFVGDASCSFTGALGNNIFTYATLSATARASADAEGLHAFASESGFSEVSSFSVQTAATVEFHDWFYFSYSQPFQVSLTMTTFGSSTGGTSLGESETTISDGNSFGDDCVFFESGNCTVNGIVNPTVGGFGLRMLLAAVAGNSGAGAFSGTSDFSDTAFISSIMFTDFNGNRLDLSFTTDSGFSYPMAEAISVPEPATVTLMAISLIGLSLTRRRPIN
jgi:hypothetical protein